MSDSSSAHGSLSGSGSQFSPTVRFPEYEDIVELGRGGMGVVFKARHRENGHYVVIKTMLKGNEGRQLQRFQREAEVLAELKHHNIVSIKSVGQSSGEYFFAMEYVEGQNLRTFVQETLRVVGQVPELERSIEIVKAIASGLADCHEKDIVHRDVKPENIVIGEDRPVLVDFGLVKHLDSQFDTTVQNLTKTGQMLGTPGFMPPEQLEFNGEYGQIGPASDVWSLGATLYFCLCGQQPFGALPFSAWCMAVVDRDPPPVKTLNPSVPQWLSELCAECLTRSPSKRPTMKSLCERLEAGEQGRPRRPKRGLALGVATVLIALTALLLTLFSRDTAPPVIELESAKVLVSSSRANPITISGRVQDRSPAWILINKKRYDLTKLGSFKIRLKGLTEGTHTLSIVAEDNAGNLSPALEVQATVDRSPPQFKLQSVTVEDKILKLDGSVSEALKSLTINGQEVQVVANQFRHDIPVSRVKGDLQFELVDLVGLKTVTQPSSFFVIGAQNSRFSSLRQAIQRAPLNATLALPPGLYRSVTPITRNATVLGLGDREQVKIQTDRPIEFRNQVTFQFRGLSLLSRREKLAKIITVSESAKLTFVDCYLSVKGFRVIEISGYEGSKNPPSLTIRRSKIIRSLGPAIAAAGAKLVIEDSHFTDWGPSMKVNQAKAFACIEMRSGSVGDFKNSRFIELLDRGILLDGSRAVVTDCEFRKSICEGAVARGRSTAVFERCQFIHNNYSGVTVTQRSEVDFFDCVFRANGFPNSPAERKNGLRVFLDSKVSIANSTVRDHNNKGLIVRGASLNIYNCKFANNKMGDLEQVSAKVTRDPPKKRP